MKFKASRPLKTNSKTLPKFSGVGAVTNMLLNPYTIALAIDIPKAADFPLPLPAVKLTVVLSYFSLIVSTIYMTALA